ncbi:hypothetical protein J6590_058650 [Homalodisca vitripennis]|nr:hypothetical protein J6590_058650 [Homalodisca vitripennis]
MISAQTVYRFINLLILTQLNFTIRVKDTNLQELGLRIKNTIEKPWGTTDQLIRDVFVYFEELEGIRKEFKEGIREGLVPQRDLPDQFEKYRQVNKTGGPIHLHNTVNIRTLIDFYKWDRDIIDEFYELLQFTREAWKKLYALLNKEECPKELSFHEKLKQKLLERQTKKELEASESIE